MASVKTITDIVFQIVAAVTGERNAGTIDNILKLKDNKQMSKPLTHLILEIDLTHYAEDSRVTIAKNFILKALHSGILGPDDIAYFLSSPDMKFLLNGEEGMSFRIEDCEEKRVSLAK